MLVINHITAGVQAVVETGTVLQVKDDGDPGSPIKGLVKRKNTPPARKKPTFFL